MVTQEKQKYILGGREYTHEDLTKLSIAVACDKKAVRPTILDLRNLSTAFTELFAIVSAANNRQVYAIAEEIRLFFKNTFGLNPVAVDGMEACTWVLLDYGFMFIHIFQEPTRELYQLEQLWSKARNISVAEEDFVPLYKEVIGALEEAKKGRQGEEQLNSTQM